MRVVRLIVIDAVALSFFVDFIELLMKCGLM